MKLQAAVCTTILAAMLAGCATGTWVKPGTTDAELARDTEQCNTIAERAVGAYRQAVGNRSRDRRDAARLQAVEQGSEMMSLRNDVLRNCYQNKGYTYIEQ